MLDSDYIKREDVKEWPIEPTFLSISREAVKNEKTASPNIDGLFSANELRGFLADASADFWDDKDVIGEGNVFTLFQLVPDHLIVEKHEKWKKWFFQYDDQRNNDIISNILKNKDIIRIHPGHLYPNRKCCEQFRKCTYISESGNRYFQEGYEMKCENKCFEMDSRIALMYHKDLPKIRKDMNGEINWDFFFKN